MLIYCCKIKIFFIKSASYRQNSFKFCPFSLFIGEIKGKRRVFGVRKVRFRGKEDCVFGAKNGGLRFVSL